MSFSHIVTQNVQVGSTLVSGSETYTGSGKVSIEETIAASTTDDDIVLALDVSAIQSIIILSDQDVKIETNDGTSPDDTIDLVADVPYVWNTDSYDSCLLTTDVTVIYVTNAGATAATLKIEALLDATP
jgi:hypothetical protein